jgi:hypothetical protein
MPQLNKHTKIWREVFLDIALRAIRRVYYEFDIGEIGQKK